MHLPLLSFIKNISTTGETTARTFYGVTGWAECHNSDIWAMSNPVGNFGYGDPVWANWNMGGAWLSTHLWEHYLFTQDKIFLKNGKFNMAKKNTNKEKMVAHKGKIFLLLFFSIILIFLKTNPAHAGRRRHAATGCTRGR